MRTIYIQYTRAYLKSTTIFLSDESDISLILPMKQSGFNLDMLRQMPQTWIINTTTTTQWLPSKVAQLW